MTDPDVDTDTVAKLQVDNDKTGNRQQQGSIAAYQGRTQSQVVMSCIARSAVAFWLAARDLRVWALILNSADS